VPASLAARWSIAAIFNEALTYEFTHMLAAAYITAGFLVAGVFAVAFLHGEVGPLPPPGLGDPVHSGGDRRALADDDRRHVARDMFQEMRVKFAAIETVWTTGPDRPETSWGD
jgi:cytochrome d ubiquinol oxidase subunit I